MGKVKSYVMDIEEDVMAIEGIEEKISEAEHIQEVEAFVFEKLNLVTHFDQSCAKATIEYMWNDLWGYYQ